MLQHDGGVCYDIMVDGKEEKAIAHSRCRMVCNVCLLDKRTFRPLPMFCDKCFTAIHQRWSYWEEGGDEDGGEAACGAPEQPPPPEAGAPGGEEPQAVELPEGFFCSELAAHCYIHLGVLPAARPASGYLPVDFGERAPQHRLPLRDGCRFGDEAAVEAATARSSAARSAPSGSPDSSSRARPASRALLDCCSTEKYSSKKRSARFGRTLAAAPPTAHVCSMNYAAVY